MTPRLPVAVVSLLTILALAGAPLRAAHASDDAEALIRQGISLRRAGKDDAALDLFQRAYAQARTPRAAGQLGLCAQALGLWVLAEGRLKEALSARQDPWIRKNRVPLEKSLESVGTHLATVEFRGEPAGAHIKVDGEEIGVLPLEARVVAGISRLEVRAPGRETITRRLVTEPSGHTRETLVLPLAAMPSPGMPASPTTAAGTRGAAAAPSAAAGAPRPTASAAHGRDRLVLAPAAEPGRADAAKPALRNAAGSDGADRATAATPDGWMRPAAWVSGGLAVSALAFGVVETVVAYKRRDEFNARMPPNATTDNGLCGEGAPDAGGLGCQDLLDRRDRALRLAIGAYVSSAVLAGAAVTFFLLSAPADEPARRAALSCGPGPAAVGAACRLTF